MHGKWEATIRTGNWLRLGNEPFRAAALALALISGPAMSQPIADYGILDWSDLDGWSEDDHRAVLDVFLETCPNLEVQEWSSVCALAAGTPGDAKTFFEILFRPVLITNGVPALFTGYFEPELEGSRERTETFRFPIYRLPPEIPLNEQWFTRGEIERGQLLADRGLEIAWLADPVDVFFLQVQGSGRIRLTDGEAIRVGFGGSNRHEYRSVGAELVRRGTFEDHQVSAAVIRNWVRRNPQEGAELLRHNPSFIFFREVNEVPSDRGPLGAMNRSITTLRSVAVDPEFVPLGAPVWIEKDGRSPMRQLMVAQDTGSAVKGPQRADIFFGTGAAAGQRAGLVRDPGRMVVLLPINLAFQLAPEG